SPCACFMLLVHLLHDSTGDINQTLRVWYLIGARFYLSSHHSTNCSQVLEIMASVPDLRFGKGHVTGASSSASAQLESDASSGIPKGRCFPFTSTESYVHTLPPGY